MKKLDLKELIKNLGLENVLIESFIKNTGKTEEEATKIYHNILNNEIDKLGQSIAQAQYSENRLSNLKDLSLNDFMKKDIKIIKDN